MISVPVIRVGAIQGYVMAQFSFTADAKMLKQLSLKADMVVLDEAFKAIYSEDTLDFRTDEEAGLRGLAKRIVEGVQPALRNAHRRGRLHPGVQLRHQGRHRRNKQGT